MKHGSLALKGEFTHPGNFMIKGNACGRENGMLNDISTHALTREIKTP